MNMKISLFYVQMEEYEVCPILPGEIETWNHENDKCFGHFFSISLITKNPLTLKKLSLFINCSAQTSSWIQYHTLKINPKLSEIRYVKRWLFQKISNKTHKQSFSSQNSTTAQFADWYCLINDFKFNYINMQVLPTFSIDDCT